MGRYIDTEFVETGKPLCVEWSGVETVGTRMKLAFLRLPQPPVFSGRIGTHPINHRQMGALRALRHNPNPLRVTGLRSEVCWRTGERGVLEGQGLSALGHT